MYHRYQPGYGTQPPKQGKPPVGEVGRIQKGSQQGRGRTSDGSGTKPASVTGQKTRTETKRIKKQESPIFKMIPQALYNPETKKILGMLSAEDLLLVALIFLMLENRETEDSILVYLLFYVLISDYIELPF